MLGLPPAFMLSLINKALDTAPSQWARSERRVSHAADHISSWRSCSKTKTNGRLRTLERCCCWFFWRAFFQVPTFVFSLEKTKRYMDFILDLHKMLWKNKYSKWWWIHLIYRRILWKKFKKSRLFFALVFFGGVGNAFSTTFRPKKQNQGGHKLVGHPAAQTAYESSPGHLWPGAHICFLPSTTLLYVGGGQHLACCWLVGCRTSGVSPNPRGWSSSFLELPWRKKSTKNM